VFLQRNRIDAIKNYYDKIFVKGRATEVDLEELNCAQIVPVKVKYFQIVPNETKS
jgi:predicted glycosyltransferase